MAQYKYRDNVTQSSSAAFDTRHAPCTVASNPGIYRCVVCSEEIVVGRGRTLPAPDHHPHVQGQPKIEWQLLVYAEQSKEKV